MTDASADRGGRAARAALLALICVAVYVPTFDAGYQHDDDVMVSENPLVRGGGRGFGRETWPNLRELWLPLAPTQHHMPGIPVTATALWLGWRLWGIGELERGAEPGTAGAAGYHVANAVLHASCTVLLWLVLAAMGVRGAWLAALVWGVHPVAVETVAWIAEIKNTLSMLFSLLCVGAWWKWLTGRGAAAWLWSCGWFALALMSKPALVSLPFALLGIAWWRQRRITARELRASIPLFALAIAAGLAAVYFQQALSIGAEVESGTPLERVIHASFALGFYAWKLLFPIGLLPVYPAWQETLPWAVQLAPAAIAAALFSAAWRRRAAWGAHVLLAGGVFVLLLAPALGIVPISSMRLAWVADRFQYHAMAAPIALLVSAAVLWTERNPGRSAVLRVAAVAVVGALCWQTARYANVFHDAPAVRAYTLARNPDVGAWQNYEGFLAFRAGRLDDAVARFEQAARANPDSFEIQNNLAGIYGQLGRNQQALEHFRRAIELNDESPVTYQGYANALLAAGRPAAAVQAYEASLALDPNNALTHAFHGTALLRTGRTEEAITAYERALALDPTLGYARAQLARARRLLVNP